MKETELIRKKGTPVGAQAARNLTAKIAENAKEAAELDKAFRSQGAIGMIQRKEGRTQILT